MYFFFHKTSLMHICKGSLLTSPSAIFRGEEFLFPYISRIRAILGLAKIQSYFDAEMRCCHAQELKYFVCSTSEKLALIKIFLFFFFF